VQDYPDEWLLPLEISEDLIKKHKDYESAETIISHLEALAIKNETIQSLISDGIALIKDR
jgi:hypothetical protein